MAGLKEALARKQSVGAVVERPEPVPARLPELASADPWEGDDEMLSTPTPEAIALRKIRSVDVECIIGGALTRVGFKDGMNPAEVLSTLRILDPAVQVRTEFPKGGAGWGKRETKSARAVSLVIDAKGDFKSVSITCEAGDEAITVRVAKGVEEWLPKLIALNKLTEKSAAKAQAAFADKKAVTLILSEPEQFGVKYSEADGGKCYFEDMTADAPAEVVK